jgi:NAD(P)H-dependent FMN reductase
MSKPRILAFAGSLRHDSLNKKLVKIAIQGALEGGAEVTYIDLRDYPLPLYDQEIEESQGLPENALKLKKFFEQHDGFLIASPEYNSSTPAVLKNVIDWVSRPLSPKEVYLCAFIEKGVALMSASPGDLGGMRGLVHLRAILSNIYSHVLPYQKSIAHANSAFDSSGKLVDAKQHQEVHNLGKRLATFLQKMKAQQEPIATH